MKEEHDKLNVPQGQGIVDWKAVKAAATHSATTSFTLLSVKPATTTRRIA